MLKIEKTVFISYRRTDVYTALAVDQYLKSQGYDVFFDYTSISSGDFEQIIVGNIKGRAHFVLILTPTALDRCAEPGDWLRREIETAIDEKRNIIPLFFKGFNYGSLSVLEKLTGKLRNLNRYNGLNIHEDYFYAGMDRLHMQFLSVALDAVLHPIPKDVQKIVKEEQAAADKDASLLEAKLLHKDESARLAQEKALPSPEFEGPPGSLVEEASSNLVHQELSAMSSSDFESAQSLPPGALAFFPTTDLMLRKKPVLSPDTLLRRIPVTEQLICVEPAHHAIPKIGVAGQWLKMRDTSNREGYVAAWLVRYASGSAHQAATAAVPVPANGGLLQVRATAEGIALREQPVVSDRTLIKRLPLGTEFTVIDTDVEVKIGKNDQWLKVKDPSGIEGYVAAWFVAPY